MFSPEEIEKAKQLVAQLGQLNLKQENNGKNNQDSPQNKKRPKDNGIKKKDANQENGGQGSGCINLLPSELLVIAGIICDVLQVESVLVTRNQVIEIVLTGTLRRRTQLDKVMEQIGKMPFDQVVKSIMNNNSDD